MKGLRLGCLLTASFLGSLLAPGPAQAGTFALMFDAGLRTMSNSPETEKAIFGDQDGIGLGLGLSYDRGLRFRLGAEVRRINRNGERAFAVDRTSEAFRLGHPLNFVMTQSLATVAFRFGKIGPVSPYLGAGFGFVSWREESNTAGVIDQADGTSGLFEGRLGVERRQGRVRLALEGGITFVPNAIGVGGISKVYEETDLGGLFVVAKIGFSSR
jgi:opacity protein-like surface antigen